MSLQGCRGGDRPLRQRRMPFICTGSHNTPAVGAVLRVPEGVFMRLEHGDGLPVFGTKTRAVRSQLR